MFYQGSGCEHLSALCMSSFFLQNVIAHLQLGKKLPFSECGGVWLPQCKWETGIENDTQEAAWFSVIKINPCLWSSDHQKHFNEQTVRSTLQFYSMKRKKKKNYSIIQKFNAADTNKHGKKTKVLYCEFWLACITAQNGITINTAFKYINGHNLLTYVTYNGRKNICWCSWQWSGSGYYYTDHSRAQTLADHSNRPLNMNYIMWL